MSDPPTSDVGQQKIIEPTELIATKKEQEEDLVAKDISQTKGFSGLSMRVKIHSPYKDYYDGQAYSLSAENKTGPFDILPKHHNFISLLSPCEIKIRTVSDNKSEIVRILISGGIIHVKADEVLVFLDV